MNLPSRILFLLALANPCLPAPAQQAAAPEPTAAAIMAQVAIHQDQAELERGRYTYVQHARVISRRGKTIMCEEITDSRITPTPTGSKAELLKLDGRLLRKHTYITYNAIPPNKDPDATQVEAGHDSLIISMQLDDDTDRDLVEHMRSNLTTDNSRDGVNARLFPLTSRAQADFLFTLVGRERRNGRDVFHIEFHPKQKDDFGWKGHAYIDTVDFEPVIISTDLARKVPLAVRTLLGTNVPGLGFTIVYAPRPDGVWFPTSLGTEFKLHVLFFFSRQIIMDIQNSAFEKTHVTSTMSTPGTPP